MNNIRQLDDLLRQLGGDPARGSVPLADFIQPVYVIDDVAQGLPNRGTAIGETTLITSAFAAEFSGFEFSTSCGFWLRRLVQRAAFNWTWTVAATLSPPFFTTVDATFPMVMLWPEGSRFLSGNNTFFGGPGGLGDGVNILRGQMGHTPSNLNGIFEVANVEAILQPVWIPPNISLLAQLVTANSAGQFRLEIEFPASAL